MGPSLCSVRCSNASAVRRADPVTLGATSTLATGVNLPARMVIVKGTKQYIDAGFVEYSDLDMLQVRPIPFKGSRLLLILRLDDGPCWTSSVRHPGDWCVLALRLDGVADGRAQLAS